MKIFPNPAEKIRALELIVSSRAQLADEKLRLGRNGGGIELFKQAVTEAPIPISDKLYSEVILQFPTNLFYRGSAAAAIEIAKLIEEKIGTNAKQLLGLAAFYLGTENAADAKRQWQKKPSRSNPNLPTAYQTLGWRIVCNFQLEDSAKAYAKALEFDPDSHNFKTFAGGNETRDRQNRMKPSRSIAKYWKKTRTDTSAQTGLTLSLFNAEKNRKRKRNLPNHSKKIRII